MYKGYITDIKGIEVGHAQDEKGITGCTLVTYLDGIIGGVDARGTVRGRRNTEDYFNPKMSYEQLVGIMMAGGSSFGLASVSAVADEISTMDITAGYIVPSQQGTVVVPVVPGVTIFDLNIGDPKRRPDYDMGKAALNNRSSKENRQGNVGAGMGATIGKVLGNEYAMKGGLGSATVQAGDVIVSAMVVVNASGDIYDYETGEQIAGCYDYQSKKLLNGEKGLIENRAPKQNISGTIGVVATNVKLDKAMANRISDMAQNGLVKTINPVNTFSDGDVIYTIGTGEIEADLSLVGVLAAEAVARSVMNAVKSAETIDGVKAFKDL